MEIETKVLEVDTEDVKKKLKNLGAKETQNTRLVVDWYSVKDAEKYNSHPWHLRVRSYSSGKSEITWKSISKAHGKMKHNDEVNLIVGDAKAASMLLKNIGLENYAHQEKDRTSFVFKDWLFELDEYPDMPAYLEIEGKNSNHIKEAIILLGLTNHENTGEGEVKIIREKYGLNWNDMRF